MTTTTTQKRITLATVKSFIKKNSDNLFINVKSSFDGMTDCCEPLHAGFVKAVKTADHLEHTQGVKGAWFVGSSRDYFTAWQNDQLIGIQVSNSCGHFILAINK